VCSRLRTAAETVSLVVTLIAQGCPLHAIVVAFGCVERTESELKTAIKKFFQFLAQEKGITNEAVLKSFHR
jgi:hypothetical protein